MSTKLDFNQVLDIVSIDSIFKQISDLDIYSFYMDKNIDTGSIYLSPFREERNPSFKFKQHKNGLTYWTDWGTGESGNVFEFVMKLYNLSFTDALSQIYSNLILNKHLPQERKQTEIPIKKEPNRIYIQRHPFTLTDKKYWGQYGITIPTLNLYNVVSCKYLWKNEKLLQKYTKSNPIYAYIFSTPIEERYKVYMPYNESMKWLSSTNQEDIQGFDQLEWIGNTLIITKSMKDCMALHELGYEGISLQGETHLLSRDLYNNLHRRYKHIFILYDNDTTGKKHSKLIAEEFSLTNIMIPEITQCKDISDYIKVHGLEMAKSLLTNLTNNVGNSEDRDPKLHRKDSAIKKEKDSLFE